MYLCNIQFLLSIDKHEIIVEPQFQNEKILDIFLVINIIVTDFIITFSFQRFLCVILNLVLSKSIVIILLL